MLEQQQAGFLLKDRYTLFKNYFENYPPVINCIRRKNNSRYMYMTYYFKGLNSYVVKHYVFLNKTEKYASDNLSLTKMKSRVSKERIIKFKFRLLWVQKQGIQERDTQKECERTGRGRDV